MAAAEYYGYDPSGRDNNNTAQSPTREQGIGIGSGGLGYSSGSNRPNNNNNPGLHLPYNNSPYNSSSQDVLAYPQSPPGHSFETYNTHPERDSLSSLNTQSKPYSDPYAENIPLNSRPPAGAGGLSSAAHTPPPINVPPAYPPLKKKRGLFASGGRRRPWFCWIMATIQVAVFIAELARNQKLTGSPIAIKPSFNPMIGPSAYVQINMGGRYVLCMKRLPAVWDDAPPGGIFFPCPNTTRNDAQCTLAQHCGFSGIPTQEELLRKDNPEHPNQWFRFITPIFLHAGIVHIGFNMLLQLRLGADMERDIGALRFGIVYFASGIFGFILGGNYAPSLIVSTGASGCLFGVLALVLLDLFYTWKERARPWIDLAYLAVDIVISFVLGLLPGLDNFAHIGGFVMGLMLGLTVLHSPDALRRKIGTRVSSSTPAAGFGMSGALRGADDPPYSPVGAAAGKEHHKAHGTIIGGPSAGPGAADIAVFVKDPVGFFRGRKPLWWVWWVVRAGMLACAVVAVSVLLKGFYVKEVECSWCKYLSCLPVLDWCDIGNLPKMNNGTDTTVKYK
ncbi:rhomboid family membrane protein-like protein [Peziza echinospora]|nr:rhomboid family membrane protein-like protein [Peziza echinospora]